MSINPPNNPLLQITRDRTNQFNLNITQSDGVTPLNITGMSLTFGAVASIGATEQLISYNSNPGGGITITNATLGQATLKFSPADTLVLLESQVATLYYDIILVNGSDQYPLVTLGTLAVYGNVVGSVSSSPAAPSPLVNVPYSSTPLFDLSQGLTFKITLTGDVTSSTIANLAPGQVYGFIICQDAVGNHLFTWPSNVRGGMVIGGTASLCSAQDFRCDGTYLFAISDGAIDE